MKALGICVGASSISHVLLTSAHDDKPRITDAANTPHHGDSRGALASLLARIPSLEELHVAATGRKFRHMLTLPAISEPEAVELAASFTFPHSDGSSPCRTIISAGGETFLVYHLDPDGRISDVVTGNKCASGTGEFLLQQLGRMDLDLEAASAMKLPDEPYAVSGRCSVFCKSDCTHALNKGIEKPRVVAGLSRMMAGKCLELLKKKKPGCTALVGGCSRNDFMVRYLEEELDELVVPEDAAWFEALGAALWAVENKPGTIAPNRAYRTVGTSFTHHPPLSDFEHLVTFKEHPRDTINAGDTVIIGLDVGSTTTKGVVMRTNDRKVLAAEYLRTDGDPVAASRKVYASLNEELGLAPSEYECIGLGVTGSGRAIAGLHGNTHGVINEIVAHATAAVFFNRNVDTIFEIGGQDAKYTCITAGVPSDNAMNEACSAGTGSFLEEAAQESLGVSTIDIGPRAMLGATPPNFNDQCAAFIGSDIKLAIQEGVAGDDILAGLVYSICMNYTNRVKGNRPVGGTVFMQGGVCYNQAVPVAMAALTGKHIVVPPDPGLMGAFGVALEVADRIEQGLQESSSFNLETLEKRKVKYKVPFVCTGGKEGDARCDRGCEIARIVIDGTTYPFGGICNRWENVRKKLKADNSSLNLPLWRERRCFRDLAPETDEDSRPTVGLNRSYLINTYFPFFNTFFNSLGFRVILPDEPDKAGMDRRGAAFCFPGELAHGFMGSLLEKEPDYLFLPHIKGVDSNSQGDTSCTCVLVQGEPYYLRTAFPEVREYKDKAFFPVLDFSQENEQLLNEMKAVGKKLKASRKQIEQAFQHAEIEQNAFFTDLKNKGQEALDQAAANDEPFSVILFGRAYNAFAQVANKGIPAKFASLGVRVIPFDMLPPEENTPPLPPDQNMYWGLGRMLLQAAQRVKANPKFFGCWITNFSCGPDSFLVGYFRDIMGDKPSLTLELDNHTADAGIETRVEAFLDIVRHTLLRERRDSTDTARVSFRPAALEQQNGTAGVTCSDGNWVPLAHERVHMLMPNMGRFSTAFFAAGATANGIRSSALPPSNETHLAIGRGNSTCKECLPLQLTVGSMLDHVQHRDADEISLFFMPSAGGPCRFGQYNVFTRNLVKKREIPDLAIFTLNAVAGYAGLSEKATLDMWRGLIMGDIFEEIWSTLLAGAHDPNTALPVFEHEFEKVREACEQGWKAAKPQLALTAKELSRIPLRVPYEEIPKISLVGEIYVRHDALARQGIIERMAERGFAVLTSKITEWVKYTDWLIRNRLEGKRNMTYWLRVAAKTQAERSIRKLLAPCGLFRPHAHPVRKVVEQGARHVSPQLTGEAILTIGAAFDEILQPSCGILCIGPFGCMPSRVAEAVLSESFTTDSPRLRDKNARTLEAVFGKSVRNLPFLAIETDGNPFPQIIEAKLEAFCLQAGRLHAALSGGQRTGRGDKHSG